MILNVNEGKSSVKTAKQTLLLSQLSTDDPNPLLNTKLMLLVRELKSQNVKNGVFNVIDQDHVQQTCRYSYETMECNVMKDDGIDFTISPLTRFPNNKNDEEGENNFRESFSLFADTLIRNIESAAQSLLFRDFEGTMNHYIVLNLLQLFLDQ
ncbi:hypothetical protein TRFO_08593 [Tritrichomonas foetus]|uniref:Uncharacterized protein n=1 Tax=Tritrichomonas foetus TaxID=1144522 RepID=A0A1J4JIR8_9EUKA|nr:hypothetical protein TRFO_08593 [Tritrichomonas foetus]|eukprot:OHS99038.1 hypothetical protein TRFO_08593 [Tritrichomonas foetus]